MIPGKTRVSFLFAKVKRIRDMPIQIGQTKEWKAVTNE